MRYLSLLLSVLLFSCTGGGGGSAQENNSGKQQEDEVSLHELSMKLVGESVVDGKQVDFVDLRLVGSHPYFKIIFTNDTNKVAVQSPGSVGADDDWENYTALAGDTTRGYPTDEQFKKFQLANPAVNQMILRFTDNPDDCRTRKTILQPGESCALYLMGAWTMNFNQQEDYSYPIGYQLDPAPGVKASKINIGQCWNFYTPDKPYKSYACRTDRKLFIKYKMTVAKPTSLDIMSVSLDGNYAYHDSYIGPRASIYKMKVNYTNGELKYGPPLWTGMRSDRQSRANPAISFNGDHYWVQYNNLGFQVIDYGYEHKPIDKYDEYSIPYGDDVDDGSVISYDLMASGLDGSVWLNLSKVIDTYGIDTYNEALDKFEHTNIPGFARSATPDGVVLVSPIVKKRYVTNDALCWIKTGVGPDSYISQPIRNFPPDYSLYYDTMFQSHNAVYIAMIMPNVEGINKRRRYGQLGFYKLHTTNEKGEPDCHIDLDDFLVLPIGGEDYVYWITNTAKFTVIQGNDKSWFVDKSQVYLGKSQ